MMRMAFLVIVFLAASSCSSNRSDDVPVPVKFTDVAESEKTTALKLKIQGMKERLFKSRVLDDDPKANRNFCIELHPMCGMDPLPDEVLKLLVWTLQEDSVLLRDTASVYLGELGPKAKKAIPAVLQATDDSVGFVRANAALALFHIDPEKTEKAVDVLKKVLENQEDILGRHAAARCLGIIGEKATPAVPALCALLNEKNDYALPDAKKWDREVAADTLKRARKAAAEALAKIRAQPETAVPALTDALNDGDSSMRWSAVLALAAFGRDAKEAIPALQVALKDEDSGVRV